MQDGSEMAYVAASSAARFIEVNNQPAASVRRKAKISLLRLLKGGGLFRLSSRRNQRAVPILCYHGIWPVADGFPGDAMFMRPETFSERMQLIDRLGLKVMPLADVVAAWQRGQDVPDNSVVITIDDGWYGTYRYMLPELIRHGFPATLYCDTAQLKRGGVVPHVMADYIGRLVGIERMSAAAREAFAAARDVDECYNLRVAALQRLIIVLGFDAAPYEQLRVFEYMTESELRQFAANGFDVQLHTHNHTMGNLSIGDVRREIEQNASALAEILDRDPAEFRHFCYPSGVKNGAIAHRLPEAGIASATTTVADLAHPSQHSCLLPRIIDGNNISEIELEAELVGIGAQLRRTFRRARAAP